jgi:hypothetical protein
MSGATMRSTGPQGGMLQLSTDISPFVMAWTLSLAQLVSASPSNPPFPPLSLARSAVAQTSASTRGRRGVTFISTSLPLPHSQLPTCCTSCRVGRPRALPKTSRLAMLSCYRVSSPLSPSKPSLLKHFEGCMDTLGCSIAVCSQGCCGLRIRG